jgi:hypothetical protein
MVLSAPIGVSATEAGLAKEANVPAGTSTVQVTIALDRPATRPARFVVGVSLPDVISPTVSSDPITIPLGGQFAEIALTVTIPQTTSPDQQYSGTVIAFPISGATASSNFGNLTLLPEGAQPRTIAVEDSTAEAQPGGLLMWDFASSDGEEVTVSLEVVEALMDFGDLDPTFLAGRGLPASGPISSGTRLQIGTTPVAPGVFRATLPLAPEATPGASITYRIGSVTGALLPTDAPSLTGTVIAGAVGT